MWDRAGMRREWAIIERLIIEDHVWSIVDKVDRVISFEELFSMLPTNKKKRQKVCELFMNDPKKRKAKSMKGCMFIAAMAISLRFPVSWGQLV